MYYKTYNKADFDSFKFSQLLYKYRTELKLSQAEMAKRLNCSTTAYNRYELGNFQRVSIKFVESLCQLTGKKVEDILYLNDNKNNAAEDTNLTMWLASKHSKPYVKEAYQKYLQDEKRKQQEKMDKVLSELSKV